ncbi:MAG: S41 family peptidase [Myxococcota bacterium]
MLLLVLTACRPAPSICEGTGPPDSEAHAVIDAFWSTLDRRYATFELRLPAPTETAWAAIGDEACRAVSADPSEEGVFDALVGMARALDDGHVQIQLGDREADGQASPWPHEDVADTLVQVAEDGYLEGVVRRRLDDGFVWGTIPAEPAPIGYVAITRLDDLDPSGSASLDTARAAEAMDAVLSDVSRTSGLIVDVRANGGGWDDVSLALAERFAGSAHVAWSKSHRNGPDHDDLTDYREIRVGNAVRDAYEGPVMLLTSRGTFSAAETFVLAMRVRDHVTVIGERTSGHFSDLYEGELPNGGSFTYSGDRYLASDGQVYEGSGAPVDLEIPFDPVAVAAGRDPQLEAAIAQISMRSE